MNSIKSVIRSQQVNCKFILFVKMCEIAYCLEETCIYPLTGGIIEHLTCHCLIVLILHGEQFMLIYTCNQNIKLKIKFCRSHTFKACQKVFENLPYMKCDANTIITESKFVLLLLLILINDIEIIN